MLNIQHHMIFSALKALIMWALSFLPPVVTGSRRQRLSGILHLTGDQFITLRSEDIKVVVRGSEITIHTFHPLSVDVSGVGSDSPSEDVDLNARIREISPIPICD